MGLSQNLKREIREEHLLFRMLLTSGGAAVVVIGSFMDWTHGLTDSAGPITEGGIGGDGRYTALLAVAVLACLGWYLSRPESRPALATIVASAILFAVSIGEWNSVSDRVESANHDNLIFATASVAPGIWIVLFGAVFALAGSIWTMRVDR